MGLLRADSGQMRVFGRPNDLNHPEWKWDIGYVGDVQVFYERWSGRKNLSFLAQFYPNWSQTLAEKLAERFRLPLKKRAKDLSTGNRVKLSLVGALAHSPKLLLLDEPTSGIDPVVRSEVLDILFEIQESGDRAIFYATHILPEISRIADELAFIDNGEVWLRTPKDDLIEQWRKLSFRLSGDSRTWPEVVDHGRDGDDHHVITSDFNTTLAQLQAAGAENIQDFRLSIEEIAVQILKGGRRSP
jgi:ABC-2 type transport system ATP-binding protein